jgi:antitoxin component of RelBE/YafQ-DinJ toxin-antitoxin module
MNLTLSVDEQILRRARKTARAMGKSVNQLVREYLEQIANTNEARRDLEELRQLSAEAKGRSGGRSFDRDEVHARS